MYEGKIKKPKSQSKRIRDLLFRIYEQSNEVMDFEDYYKMRTDKIIAELQKELEPPLPEEEK